MLFIYVSGFNAPFSIVVARTIVVLHAVLKDYTFTTLFHVGQFFIPKGQPARYKIRSYMIVSDHFGKNNRLK